MPIPRNSAILAALAIAFISPASAATIAGNIDGVRLNADGTFTVSGWACAVGNPKPIAVDLYFNGAWPSGSMQKRADANLASEAAVSEGACRTPGVGHRFKVQFPASLRPQYFGQKVYAHAISPDGTGNPLLTNSGRYAVPAGPIGFIDRAVVNGDGTASIHGWACALGSPASIPVDLYLGGAAPSGKMLGRTLASQVSEPAVAQACKSTGTAYRFTIPLSSESRSLLSGQKIHVHGIDPAGAGNPVLTGSGNFLVPGPAGQVESATTNPEDGTVSISGWACIPGVTASINVDLYLAGPWPSGVMQKRLPANLANDSLVGAVCSSAATPSRFKFTIPPAAAAQFSAEKIFAHAVNPNGGASPLLAGSGDVRMPFSLNATPPDTIRIANTGKYMIGTYVFPGWTPGTMASASSPLDAEGWQPLQQWQTILNAPAAKPEAGLPALARGADQPKRPVLNTGAFRNEGFYNDADRNAVDWMIKWSLESGVSLFVHDWYWNGIEDSRFWENKEPLNQVDPNGRVHYYKPSLVDPLEKGFLQSKYFEKYSNDIRFALLFSNTYGWCFQGNDDKCARLSAVDAEAQRKNVRFRQNIMIDYAIKFYFNRPQYLKIDNKPVFIIWSVNALKLGLAEPAASEVLRSTIELWQQKARDAGFEGIYFISKDGQETPDLHPGVEGLTAYSYHETARLAAIRDPASYRASTAVATGRKRWNNATPTSATDLVSNPTIGVSIPFDAFTDHYKRIWNQSHAVNRNYLPVLSPGWDNTPWNCREQNSFGISAMSAYCNNVLIVTHPENRKDYKLGYKRQLIAAKAFVDTHATLQTVTPKGTKTLLLNEAWDEWGEGAVLAPTEKWGFSLLDGIREVFGAP